MTRLPVPCLAAIVLLSACGATSLTSDHYICEFRDSAGEVSSCGDWKTVPIQYRTTIQTFCKAAGHTLSTGECPTEKRLAGCRAMEEGSTAITWYYQSAKFPDRYVALKDCAAEKQWVTPEGVAADRGNGMCSASNSGAAALVTTVFNKTAAVVSVWLRDSTCVEVSKLTVASMGGQGTTSRKDDVLVIRAGDNDPFGKVLKEITVTSSGPVNVQ
jgi:hypothetical protein